MRFKVGDILFTDPKDILLYYFNDILVSSKYSGILHQMEYIFYW